MSRGQNLIVESKGIAPILNVGYLNTTLTSSQEAEAFALTAKLFISRNGASLTSFQDYAACLNRVETSVSSYPQYRTMDGFGNNLKHPYWGASETPFGRFGPKNYADGVFTMRKSDRVSQYLPSPREIVAKILKKAPKAKRTSRITNSLLLQFLVAFSHDAGHSLPVAANDGSRIGCCLKDNKGILPRQARNSACIPIPIPKDDAFYNASGTRCTSVVRSQTVSTPSGVQVGKIFTFEVSLKNSICCCFFLDR